MRRFYGWLWVCAIVGLTLGEVLAGRAAADVPEVLRI